MNAPDRPLVISRPGIYEITAEDYHADPAVTPSLSASIARTLLSRSPRHAWIEHPRLNPRWESSESKEFDRGRAAHALILEGENRMEIVHAKDWRKKDAHEQRDLARSVGKHPVLEEEYLMIVEMRGVALEAIRTCTDLSGYTLADGRPELSLIWDEGETWCRARPDFLANDMSLFIDYKTTKASANPEDVVRTIVGQGYDVQDAFYRRGLSKIRGQEGARFVFLFQEVQPPFACSFVSLSPEFLAIAQEKVAEALDTWAACMAANEWPVYPNRIAYLDPPGYFVQRWEGRENRAGKPYKPEDMWPDLPDGDGGAR